MAPCPRWRWASFAGTEPLVAASPGCPQPASHPWAAPSPPPSVGHPQVAPNWSPALGIVLVGAEPSIAPLARGAAHVPAIIPGLGSSPVHSSNPSPPPGLLHFRQFQARGCSGHWRRGECRGQGQSAVRGALGPRCPVGGSRLWSQVEAGGRTPGQGLGHQFGYGEPWIRRWAHTAHGCPVMEEGGCSARGWGAERPSAGSGCAPWPPGALSPAWARPGQRSPAGAAWLML